MGSCSQENILVANAFPQDIYVRAKSVEVASHEETTDEDFINDGFQKIEKGRLSSIEVEVELNACNRSDLESSGQQGTSVENTLEMTPYNSQDAIAIAQRMMREYDAGCLTLSREGARGVQDAGFSVMLLTVLYYDSEGNERKIAKDEFFYDKNETGICIVTATGDIVNAKDKDNPWIDWNDVDQSLISPCEVCSEMSSVCSLCTVESSFEKLANSICRGAERHRHQSMPKLFASAKKSIRKYNFEGRRKAKEFTKKIEEIAESYALLEAETKRAVRSIEICGMISKDAAKEYLENADDLAEFLHELSDMKKIENDLMRANNQHMVIKKKLSLLLEEIKEEQKRCADEASQSTSAPNLFGDFTAAELALAVSLGGGIMMRIGLGRAGACLLGYGITGIYMASQYEYDAKDDEKLAKVLFDISVGVGCIEIHLKTIISSIEQIEVKWQLCQNAEKTALKQLKKQDPRSIERRKKKVEMVLRRSEELIQACKEYYRLTEEGNDSNSDTSLAIGM